MVTYVSMYMVDAEGLLAVALLFGSLLFSVVSGLSAMFFKVEGNALIMLRRFIPSLVFVCFVATPLLGFLYTGQK